MINTNFRFLQKAIKAIHKLQKNALIDLCQDLIYEKFYLSQINEFSPMAIAVFADDFHSSPIYETSFFKKLYADIFALKKHIDKEGTYSLQDMYKNERIFNVKHQIFENYYIVYITELTTFVKQDAEIKTDDRLSALETLAANISHEIKNPLSAIDIHTQLLQYKIKNQKIEVSSEILQYIDIVKNESDRLLKVLDMFLNMTRKSKPSLEFIEISKTLTHISQLLQVELENQQIQLSLELGTIPKIFTSQFMLQQIILDLLRNSIESFDIANTNKQIKITTTESNTKSHILIIIDDSGCGIPQDIKYKIFDPYFTTKKSGTGLGLTLVNKMVGELSGTIYFADESELGGTKVIISLPISKNNKQRLLEQL